MTTGPSVWWPLDVDVERWFTEEERAAACEYHRPIERGLVWRSVAQLSLLVAVLIAASVGELGAWTQVGAVVGAVALPRLVVDGWREYVHEPRFGAPPVSAAAALFTGSARLAVDLIVIVSAYWWITTAPFGSADLAIAAAGAVAVPMVAALLGPRLVLSLHRILDLSDDGRSRRVAELAAARGLGQPRFVVLDPVAFDGANALVTGTGRRVTVAVSRRLLEAPDELFDHVVGHELAHLRRRHVWWSALVSGLSLAAILMGSALAVQAYASESARLPALVLVAGAASMPFGLGLAWLSRGNERQADHDALRIAPVAPEVVRQLHLDQRPNLEPSAIGRWFGAHPPPAERLERVARVHFGSSRVSSASEEAGRPR